MDQEARRILIIDDELSRGEQSAVFSRAFAFPGFSYVFAEDHEKALTLLREGEEFALILLDLRFEGSGDNHGMEILEDLVNKGCLAPIIILTSIDDPKVIIQAWQLGAKGYIIKWAFNERFHDDLRLTIDQHALRRDTAGFDKIRAKKREQLRDRTAHLVKKHGRLEIKEYISQALRFKDAIGGEWAHPVPIQSTLENYVRGWNASEADLAQASEMGELLFINMDLGRGCRLRCPHCFTQEGDIDQRGRSMMPYGLLKERILEAKELGLRAVRILGAGEPTQWVRPEPKRESGGGDILDFLDFLAKNEIIPLLFTRGQVLGSDKEVEAVFGEVHDIHSGEQLVRRLDELRASVFLGVSSIFPELNNEMVGMSRESGYDGFCRNSLRMLVSRGFNSSNPTRVAVESPITRLNIGEMAVRYVLFQLLNISPCMNVYMVTGRTKAYGLVDITDPSQDEFLGMYATISHFMRRLGISSELGPYAGTKECHDVSHGMYLTLNGDVYPCPGYENIQAFVGNARTHSIKQIWENNTLGRGPQSICPPKVSTHFPPDFRRMVERRMQSDASFFDQAFDEICEGLGADPSPTVGDGR